MYTFSTCLFFFFFPTICSFLFLTARLRFVQTPTPSGQHWNRFFQTFFFSFKKTSCSQKKREFLIFFSKPKFFFAICFLFDKRKKRSKMKNTIRERRYPERFSPYFLYFKIWWRDGVLHVPGNSQFVIIAHSNFIYNTSGCNCIKTNTFKALNKYHNRGHILEMSYGFWVDMNPPWKSWSFEFIGNAHQTLSTTSPPFSPPTKCFPFIIPNPLLLKK